MKTSMLCALMLLCSLGCFAQGFQLTAGAGNAWPKGFFARRGAVVYIEPSYRISNAFSVGLRAEWTNTARGATTQPTFNSYQTERKPTTSFSLNAQYSFLVFGKIRPFIGAGIGVYSLGRVSQTSTYIESPARTYSDSYTMSGGQKFGFYPRVGVGFRNFNVALEYNILPSRSQLVFALGTADGQGNPITIIEPHNVNNGYASIKAGYTIQW